MGARYVKVQIKYRYADLEKHREFALQFLKDFQGIAEDIALLLQDEISAGAPRTRVMGGRSTSGSL